MAAQRFLTVEQGIEHLLRETPTAPFQWCKQDGVGRLAEEIPNQPR